MLERLAPEERAAFLLHEMFDSDYGDIAQILGKSEVATRQIVSRATRRVRAERPRVQVSADAKERLLSGLVQALQTQDKEGLLKLLAKESAWTSDGGGKALAARKVIRGAEIVARFATGVYRKIIAHIEFRRIVVNGEPGVAVLHQGQLFCVLTIRTDGARILDVFAILNPDKLRAVTLKTKEPMMKTRIDLTHVSPRAVQAMFGLQNYVNNSGLERSLLELVKMRASQINGCAYCLDMHTKDARAAGETEQRLYLLDAWREAPFYSARERAALEWTEALTLVHEDHVPDAAFAAVREQFSEEEVVNLSLAEVSINGWNRLSNGLRKAPGTYQVPAQQTKRSVSCRIS
jgi:AhpD family alkylhydroperoxidase